MNKKQLLLNSKCENMKAKQPRGNNVEPNSPTRVNKVKLLGKKDCFIDLHFQQ